MEIMMISMDAKKREALKERPSKLQIYCFLHNNPLYDCKIKFSETNPFFYYLNVSRLKWTLWYGNMNETQIGAKSKAQTTLNIPFCRGTNHLYIFRLFPGKWLLRLLTSMWIYSVLNIVFSVLGLDDCLTHKLKSKIFSLTRFCCSNDFQLNRWHVINTNKRAQENR